MLVMLVIIVIGGMYFYKRNKAKKEAALSEGEVLNDENSSDFDRKMKMKAYRRDTGFTYADVLGRGAFYNVLGGMNSDYSSQRFLNCCQ